MSATLLTSILFAQVLNAGTPAIWVTVGRHSNRTESVALKIKLTGKATLGDSVINYLTLVEEEAESNNVRTVAGPFTSKEAAFRFGYSLLTTSPLVAQFSLTRIDGSAVSLKMRRSRRMQLIPGLNKPWPQLGIVLSLKALGWGNPLSRLGAKSTARVIMGYRDEVWILGEKRVCAGSECHRWFQTITPAPHRISWFQAGPVVPLKSVRSLKDGQGKLINYTSVIHIGRSGTTINYQAVRFMPGKSPFKQLFTLPRLFYLKLSRDKDGKWKAVDRRGVEQYQLSKYSQWRPVSSLFRRHRRRIFFN